MTNEEFIKSISLDGEIWKDVVGYEGLYSVSNTGRVISFGRTIQMINKRTNVTFSKTYKPKTLKQCKDKGEYLTVQLSDYNQNTKNVKVHRLVAMAFIPNPEDKPQVDHIDRNRSNNSVDNLRWCTSMENHSNFLTQCLRATPVQQFSLEGKLLNIFSSTKKAGILNHCNRNKIKECCEGKIQSYKGFIWKYITTTN